MLRAFAAAVVLLCAGSSRAHQPPGIAVNPPLVLRLEGRFAEDRARAHARGADAVSVRVGGAERWFSAEKARTVGGDQALDGRSVLAMLAPIHPNLIAVGSRDLRERLAAAPAGTPVAVEGLVNRGSHTFLLRDVTVGTSPAQPLE
jgi:hypothetical protein